MKLIIKELLSANINEDNILYIHSDQRPYAGITTQKQFDNLIGELLKKLVERNIYSLMKYKMLKALKQPSIHGGKMQIILFL